MCICLGENACCVFHTDTLNDSLLTDGLELPDAIDVGSLEQTHHVVKGHLTLVSVEEVEYVQDRFITHVSDLHFGCLCFPHLTLEHAFEIATSRKYDLMTMQHLTFTCQLDITVLLIVDKLFQIRHQCARRNLFTVKIKQKVVKVIESRVAIIPAEDVKSVLHHHPDMAET